MRPFAFVGLFLLAAVAATAGYFQYEHAQEIRREAVELTGGDPEHGRDAIRIYGCAACHDIPGFSGTTSHVGPPLTQFALRAYIGGAIENRPENLMRFLREPRTAVPRGAMPNLGISQTDAHDLAAFLYTLQ